MPLLSFCIPTHNCPILLRMTLLSIFASCEAADFNDFEINISDNSDVSYLEFLMEAFEINRSKKIIYHYNPSLISPFLNQQNALMSSKGSYKWLMGDDVLLLNAVSRIIPHLKLDKYFLISCGFFADWRNEITRRPYLDFHYLSYSAQDKVVRGIPSLLLARGGSWGFMSTFIFNAKYLDASIPRSLSITLDSYPQCQWPQILFLIQSSLVNNSAVHISTPLVLDPHMKDCSVPDKPWPWSPFIYTSDLWLVFTFHKICSNSLDSVKLWRAFLRFYLYVFCDQISFKQFISSLNLGFKLCVGGKYPFVIFLAYGFSLFLSFFRAILLIFAKPHIRYGIK